MMMRKRWSAQKEITPGLLKFREKRKWQMALRRYVLEKNVSVFYAPYFGLDIEKMRRWFEVQFEAGVTWTDFGKKWQFEHIIPVACFDFSREADLKMCWSFINLRAIRVNTEKCEQKYSGFLAAKKYFEELYASTNFSLCLKLLEKIDLVEAVETIDSQKQQLYMKENKPYLEMLENYTDFEFELLNNGRSVIEVNKEIEFFKKFAEK